MSYALHTEASNHYHNFGIQNMFETCEEVTSYLRLVGAVFTDTSE